MTARSTAKASSEGLEIIRKAIALKGWRKTSPAFCDAACVSTATLKRFWRGIPISQDSFTGVCRSVGVDIADIVEVAPELAIEILSPQQSPTKVIKKITHCLTYGSQLGWLIDPKERTVLVFRPAKAIEILEAPAAQLPMPEVLSQLELTVKTLFGWLQV